MANQGMTRSSKGQRRWCRCPGSDSHNRPKQMDLYNKILTGIAGACVVLAGVAVIAAPVAVQADQQAKQFEQSYCFTASGADRWKSCR